jgi:hypothetical protein
MKYDQHIHRSNLEALPSQMKLARRIALEQRDQNFAKLADRINEVRRFKGKFVRTNS